MTDQSSSQPTLTIPHQDLSTDEASEHEFVANQFEREVQRIVDDLHGLAEKVSRVTAPGPHQNNPGFGPQASTMLADISNAIANLGLGALVRSATEADTALLQRRLIRAVHENDTLRANQHLPITPITSPEA